MDNSVVSEVRWYLPCTRLCYPELISSQTLEGCLLIQNPYFLSLSPQLKNPFSTSPMGCALWHTDEGPFSFST